jgi:hypothetical protein
MAARHLNGGATTPQQKNVLALHIGQRMRRWRTTQQHHAHTLRGRRPLVAHGFKENEEGGERESGGGGGFNAVLVNTNMHAPLFSSPFFYFFSASRRRSPTRSGGQQGGNSTPPPSTERHPGPPLDVIGGSRGRGRLGWAAGWVRGCTGCGFGPGAGGRGVTRSLAPGPAAAALGSVVVLCPCPVILSIVQ